MTYVFTYSINLAKLSTAVGQIVDEVNESMHSFGFPEKMLIRSNTVQATLSNVSELTVAQERMIAAEILSRLRDKFPEYDFQFEGAKGDA